MKITEQDIKDLGLTRSKETKIQIYIQGDVNDADYIENTSELESIKEYKQLLEIADKILNYAGHNWSKCHKYLNSEEIDLISNYLPYLDNEDIHTIEAISFKFIIDGVIYK